MGTFERLDLAMAARKKRKGGGSKLARSQVVTVRLDPKLRYLAELAARQQRRTLSSFIEWAVEESLAQVELTSASRDERVTIADEAERLWDVDEPDRLVRLGILHPELLTHDEQVVWKLIRENGFLWSGYFKKRGDQTIWTWEVQESSLISDRLREHWDVFKAVAEGKAEATSLPDWERERRSAPDDQFDDDIPF